MLDIDHTAARAIEELTAATGAGLFLDPRAAQALSVKVLDVRRRHAGRVHVGVYPQA